MISLANRIRGYLSNVPTFRWFVVKTYGETENLSVKSGGDLEQLEVGGSSSA